MPEDRKARINRELIELLNELRVVLPGAQVLFAFLLTLPFSQVFATLTRVQRDAFVWSFLCTGAAMMLLMAPSAHHRLRFREQDKERMLFWFNRLVIAGTVFLAMAIAGVVFLVIDVIYGSTVAAVASAIAAAWLFLFWYAIPLWYQRGLGPKLPDTRRP